MTDQTDVAMTTDRSGVKYVGDKQAANTATFTWTPKNLIQMTGGSIDIITPVWY